MSEKKLFPAELRVLLLAGAVGVMVTAGGLAAMAALMTAQGYSGAAAPPLATAAVGAGSLCSGWIAAFCKKERGLLCGLVQGLFYAALLVVLSVPSGTRKTRSAPFLPWHFDAFPFSPGLFSGTEHLVRDATAGPSDAFWRIAGHGDPGEKAPQLNK